MEENKKHYRNYQDGSNSITNIDVVKDQYCKARMYQSVEYVERMHQKYFTFNNILSFDEIIENLSKYIDLSDPDINLPNMYHLFQTADGLRRDNKPKWMEFVGFIHDMGKIIHLWGCDEDGTSMTEQWGTVGDTFLVGCPKPDTLVYPEFNELSPEKCYNEDEDVLSNTYGIYQKHCGLDNCIVSFGHDEYMYKILRCNGCIIPEEGYYIIRFHSMYCYHSGEAYICLMNEKDKEMLPFVQEFQKYDLYTKQNIEMPIEDLIDRYREMWLEFMPNGLEIAL
jgi:inositol oxygenase